jgi:hypothetical protein
MTLNSLVSNGFILKIPNLPFESSKLSNNNGVELRTRQFINARSKLPSHDNVQVTNIRFVPVMPDPRILETRSK